MLSEHMRPTICLLTKQRISISRTRQRSLFFTMDGACTRAASDEAWVSCVGANDAVVSIRGTASPAGGSIGSFGTAIAPGASHRADNVGSCYTEELMLQMCPKADDGTAPARGSCFPPAGSRTTHTSRAHPLQDRLNSSLDRKL